MLVLVNLVVWPSSEQIMFQMALQLPEDLVRPEVLVRSEVEPRTDVEVRTDMFRPYRETLWFE